ncbi:MAG TPA: phenylalanine--tRNA ligase subunit alpha [Planctomycetota bacterium]|nr:phenylalanine--tRNA ligase subunit alpha [Planctomycetota bacterium]
MSLIDDLEQLRKEATSAFAAASGDAKALEAARIKYLGAASGRMKELMGQLGKCPPEIKPQAGKLANTVRNELEAAFKQAQGSAPSPKSSAPAFDVTEPLPSEVRHVIGKRHPMTRTVDRLVEIFHSLGFDVVEGPEIEDQRHNFDDLNVPKDHPARDSFDTFFVAGNPDALLRSQTSTVQVRVMETRKPPVRVIAPGRVYRPDNIDATHHSTFHQIEGLYVDKNVSMADLKGTLKLFLSGLFGTDLKVRFRPSFFPFTEPSAELDCTCPACGGTSCSVCKYSGWVEMGGCGMVDPNVFKAINHARGDNAYDPEVWSGFAFGFGIERLAMRRHGITDIRRFLENDLRFLRQV